MDFSWFNWCQDLVESRAPGLSFTCPLNLFRAESGTHFPPNPMLIDVAIVSALLQSALENGDTELALL